MQLVSQKFTKEALKLALPVMLTQVGQVSVNLFDNMIVGNLLGSHALASVSLGNAIFFSFFVLALGFSFAIPPLVSEAHARQDHETVNKVFRHGFIINLAIGTLLFLVMQMTMPLMYHTGQDPTILPKTQQFLGIMAFSIIPFMIFQTFREVSEGLSFTIGVTKATIAANIINIALNYVFIKGLFGFPEMGVRGSAIATLIARIFMTCFLLFIMYREPKTKRYIQDFSLRIKGFSKELFKKMLKIGFPTAMQMFFEVTAFAAAAFICGKVSADDLAAHQIALSMASFTFNLCIGFSVASTVMVGRKLGEQNFIDLRKIGINNFKLAFIFMLCCGLFFIICRNILPTFFTKPNEIAVLNLASKLLIITALFQLSDGIQVTALGTLRGLQDVKVPSYITFVAYWIITLPLGYFLCINLKMGAFGMWIALGLGLTISAVFLVYRFLKLSGKRILENNPNAI